MNGFEHNGYHVSDDLIEGVLNAKAKGNIDGYGDEGAGYDGGDIAKALIDAGWTPPAPEGPTNE